MIRISGLAVLLLLLAAVLVFTKADQEDEDDTPCVKEDLDDYLDRVLEKARKNMPDPMRLPPKSTIVELYEGLVWGLATLHRAGPVEVSCEDNETVIVKGKLGVEELKGRYTWEKELSSRTLNGFAVLIVDDFSADVQFSFKRQEGAHPRLDLFKIKNLKDVRIEITGLGFITWALASLSTQISGLFRHSIAKAVSGPLREAIERELLDMSIKID